MEIRANEISYRITNEKIEGRAIVFNSISNVLYDAEKKRFFQEIMAPGSITQELVDKSDIKFLINHQRDHMVARRRQGKGSLNVEVREDGVYFSFEKPNTTDGNDLYEMIQRGDMTSCSFAFVDSDVEWDFQNRECPVRTVKSVRALFDLSCVADPAYSETAINARNIEDLEAQYKAEIEEVKPIEEIVNEEPKEEMNPEPVETPKEEEQVINQETEERAQDDTYLSALKPYEDILAAL